MSTTSALLSSSPALCHTSWATCVRATPELREAGQSQRQVAFHRAPPPHTHPALPLLVPWPHAEQPEQAGPLGFGEALLQGRVQLGPLVVHPLPPARSKGSLPASSLVGKAQPGRRALAPDAPHLPPRARARARCSCACRSSCEWIRPPAAQRPPLARPASGGGGGRGRSGARRAARVSCTRCRTSMRATATVTGVR